MQCFGRAYWPYSYSPTLPYTFGSKSILLHFRRERVFRKPTFPFDVLSLPGLELSTTSTTTTTKSWKHQVEEGQNLNEKEDDEDDPRSVCLLQRDFFIHLTNWKYVFLSYIYPTTLHTYTQTLLPAFFWFCFLSLLFNRISHSHYIT